jgi:hypothetical protein
MGDRRRLSGRYQVGDDLLLRVDIDGPTPLGVLSLAPAPDDGSGGWALLARVESRTRERDVIVLTARVWPRAGITDEPMLDIEVVRVELRRGRRGCEPSARVELFDGDGRSRGCWRGPRASASFRSVCLDIDREPDALPMPVYATHAHADRPASLRSRSLSVAEVYDDAGVELRYRAPERPTQGLAPRAGLGQPWTIEALHDSMARHWAGHSRERQWRMWLLLACRFERSRVAGLMFDTDASANDGASRRGVALFTRCAYFHDPAGVNAQANPPAQIAADRELFFNLIHEIGHVFNLPHPFERNQARWPGPDWFEPTRQPDALSWMSYPNDADPERRGGARWFYKRFRFRFSRRELLFLRHAPERCVVMGGASWLHDHARAPLDEPRS